MIARCGAEGQAAMRLSSAAAADRGGVDFGGSSPLRSGMADAADEYDCASFMAPGMSSSLETFVVSSPGLLAFMAEMTASPLAGRSCYGSASAAATASVAPFAGASVAVARDPLLAVVDAAGAAEVEGSGAAVRGGGGSTSAVNEVGLFLTSLGLDKYQRMFHEAEIDTLNVLKLFDETELVRAFWGLQLRACRFAPR